MHYYQLHIGDWIKKTSHLNLQEEAIYHRLLMLYYDKERPIPADVKVISRLIRCRGEEEIITELLNEFFKKKGKKWIHNRAEEELKKYHNKSEKAQKSAKARWNKDLTPCERIPNAMQTQCEGNANQEPITKNHKPITTNQEIIASYYGAAMPCKNNELYFLPNELYDKYKTAYPLINLDSELDKITIWLNSNQPKLKTVKGMPRFINNWLGRAKPPDKHDKTHETDFIELHTSTDWADSLN
jgi:uncharacterized protein YdaU (DUF1376 family)